jgi:hypothetical protein
MAIVAGHGLAPSEFWKMTVAEIAVFFEAKRPKETGDYAGSLNQGSVDDLSEWMRTWENEPTAPCS